MSAQALGTILILLALLSWAGNALVGRSAPDADVPPLALNFWRWVVAFMVLAPFALSKLHRQWPLFRAHWWLWAVFGIISVAGFNAMILRIPAEEIAVVVLTNMTPGQAGEVARRLAEAMLR